MADQPATQHTAGPYVVSRDGFGVFTIHGLVDSDAPCRCDLVEDWPRSDDIDFATLERRYGRDASTIVRAMINGEWAGASTALIADISYFTCRRAYVAIKRLCDAGLMLKTLGVISRTNWELLVDCLPRLSGDPPEPR